MSDLDENKLAPKQEIVDCELSADAYRAYLDKELNRYIDSTEFLIKTINEGFYA